jgi:hypothetical protein
MDADIIFHDMLWKAARSTKYVAVSPNRDGMRSEQEWRQVANRFTQNNLRSSTNTQTTERDYDATWQGNRTVSPGQDHRASAWWWYAWRNEGAKRRERNKRAAGG